MRFRLRRTVCRRTPSSSIGTRASAGLDPDEAEALEAAALARVPQVIPQIHVQALLYEFRRRQRHASLLVAGSIATAILLTVGGLLIIAQMAVPRSVDGDNRPALRSTSVAWQRPVQAGAGSGHEFAVVSANRATKGAPLLVPKFAEPTEPAAPAQVILAASGRQIAFAPLLPLEPCGLSPDPRPPRHRQAVGRTAERKWDLAGEG